MALVKFNNGTTVKGNYPSFNDLFDTFFKDSYINDRVLTKVPAVNISESEEAFEIELAAPGVKKEDFKLNLEKNVLTVSTEQKEQKIEETKKVSRKEFSYSSFSRSFTLPESADQNKINASYESGILYVTIGKKEEAKNIAREIAVK
jgi:HSP20 family protein